MSDRNMFLQNVYSTVRFEKKTPFRNQTNLKLKANRLKQKLFPVIAMSCCYVESVSMEETCIFHLLMYFIENTGVDDRNTDKK